jgi:DNA-binding Xre family transcriptional regulator
LAWEKLLAHVVVRARSHTYRVFIKEIHAMPRIDVEALGKIMLRRKFLFKHQIANLVGISYDRLTQIIAHGESEVEEDIVTRLCAGLDCTREEIVVADDGVNA